MNQNLPSLENFIKFIDTNNKLPKSKLISELTFIVLVESLKLASSNLNEEQAKKVRNFLDLNENFQLNMAVKVFEENHKTKELNDITKKVTSEIKKDYIKTQLVALNQKDKEKALQKFPQLKELI